MDNVKRDLIRRRAEFLFPMLRDYLMQDGADFVSGEGFKYAFLVLRGPKAYLNTFESGELKINPDAIDEILWTLRSSDFPGVLCLCDEEKELITQHNIEAELHRSTFNASSPGLRTTVLGLGSPRSQYGLSKRTHMEVRFSYFQPFLKTNVSSHNIPYPNLNTLKGAVLI